MYLWRYFPNEHSFECAEVTYAVSHRQNRQPVFRMNCDIGEGGGRIVITFLVLPVKTSDKSYENK